MHGDGYNNHRAGVPAGEVDYLAKAGALLDKAAEQNEIENRRYPELMAKGQERMAAQYAQLAAIQRGQLPADIVKQVLDSITAGRN